MPPKIEEWFLPPGRAAAGRGRLVYRPAALGVATLHYTKARTDIDVWRSVALLAPLREDESLRMPWEAAAVLEEAAPDLDDEPVESAEFASLPAAAARPATRFECGRRGGSCDGVCRGPR